MMKKFIISCANVGMSYLCDYGGTRVTIEAETLAEAESQMAMVIKQHHWALVEAKPSGLPTVEEVK